MCDVMANCTGTATFYNNGTNTCDNCTNGCAACQNATKCTTCAEGYYQDPNTTLCTLTSCGDGKFFNNGTSKCEDCLGNCKTCNDSTTCMVCNAGFFYEEATGDNKCSACIDDCTTCKDNSTCDTCMDGWHVEDDVCVDDDCADGTYWDKDAKACTNCKEGCLKCKDATTCEQCAVDPTTNKCEKGSFWKDTACVSCGVAYCMDCSAENNCTSCYAGYTLINGTTCNATTGDTAPCGDGFYRDTDSKCQKCSGRCKHCTNGTSCLECFSSNLITWAFDNKTCGFGCGLE